MNARERVLAAIEHREPDRVPIDLGSTPSSGISAIAYGNLKKHLGITEGHTRIYDLMPDLIEAGYDVINPIQTNCRDMDPAQLKAEFGKDICFWGGGVDPRMVLNRGTPEDVRRQVLERLEIFAPGGGFVFNTVHNILSEVPPQNIVAMYDAVEEFNS